MIFCDIDISSHFIYCQFNKQVLHFKDKMATFYDLMKKHVVVINFFV